MEKRNSIVILAKNINMDKEYSNVIDYHENDLVELCESNDHLVAMQNDYSFLKVGDNVINVGLPYATCLQANYLCMQNPYYNNKWFFAFIDKVEYNSEKSTLITYTIDEISTWWDYWGKNKTSFIEREHVNDDTVGLHTIPEGLETGDYICNGVTSLYSAGNSTYICVATSEVPSELGTNVYHRQYNGIYSGVTYVVFETPLAASNFIRALDGLGKGDAITSVFLIPINLTGTLTFTTYNIHIKGDQYITTQAAFPPYSTTFVDLGTVASITSPSSLNGYTPKNGKLFCYPYNYFYVTNNSGMDIDYHYEDFVNNTASFKTVGAITPGCSIKCFPLNYKKLADTSSSMNSYNYGISAAKYPICSWSSDVYTNWLTQNGINILGHNIDAKTAGVIKGVSQIGASLAMPVSDFAPMFGTGVRTIYDIMQENYRHSLIPDSARGNTNSGDITFSSARMDIPLYKMSIRYEFAKSIDDFLTMFGYKVNTLKVPNFTGREYYNYVKIAGSEIIGYSNQSVNVPDSSMDIINAVFRKGTTIWHNHDNIGNYNLNNRIL